MIAILHVIRHSQIDPSVAIEVSGNDPGGRLIMQSFAGPFGIITLAVPPINMRIQAAREFALIIRDEDIQEAVAIEIPYSGVVRAERRKLRRGLGMKTGRRAPVDARIDSVIRTSLRVHQIANDQVQIAVTVQIGYLLTDRSRPGEQQISVLIEAR